MHSRRTPAVPAICRTDTSAVPSWHGFLVRRPAIPESDSLPVRCLAKEPACPPVPTLFERSKNSFPRGAQAVRPHSLATSLHPSIHPLVSLTAISLLVYRTADQLSPASRLSHRGAQTTKPLTIHPAVAKQPHY